MSKQSDDLDALDNLLAETLGAEEKSAPRNPEVAQNAQPAKVNTQTESSATSEPQNMTSVWAEVIERATANMQDSARMSQQAAQKNIELAKKQSDSIKELADSSTGWRNVARQTYEEIMSAKKSVRNMSIFVLLGVIIGTSLTTLFSWYQGQHAQQGNHILQVTIEEYYDAMSKDLSAKLEEMVGLIEQIPTSPTDGHKAHRSNDTDDTEETDEAESPAHAKTSVDNSAVVNAVITEQFATQQESLHKLEDQLEKVLSLVAQQQTQQAQIQARLDSLSSAPAVPTSIAVPRVATQSASPLNEQQDAIAGSLNQTQKSLTQLHTKLAGLEQQLTQIDQQLATSQASSKTASAPAMPAQLEQKIAGLEQGLTELTQLMKQRPASAKPDTEMNKSISEQLSKLQKDITDIKQTQYLLKTSKAANATGQEKELNDQVIRLQRDIRELKQQSSMKEQSKETRQSLPAQQSTPPYQYRLDVERYPR